MSIILDAIERYAEQTPNHIALDSSLVQQDYTLSYTQLYAAVHALARLLEQEATVKPCIAIYADNVAATVVADLACIQTQSVTVPVPLFFSLQQFKHLLDTSAVSLLLTTMPTQLCAALQAMQVVFKVREDFNLNGVRLSILKIFPADKQTLADEGIAKITYTSGSTGEPKGVCLTQRAMEQVAQSLCQQTQASAQDRHLCLLPYATLLENIGGMYAPLLAGATVCLPGLKGVGMQGASDLNIAVFMQAFQDTEATTCIMIPQMLQALIGAISAGMPKPTSLRYIAVGGAPVSLQLLQQAGSLNLPVYEGYGLSEAASVVAMNREGAAKVGSVGKPLPHITLDFADDGEILVRGSLFSGYLHETSRPGMDSWATGDIGYLDDKGFLHLIGRKKHMFITSFGRNVSPEWVESELTTEDAIAQACVFGEAKPFNIALIVSRISNTIEEQRVVETAIAQANRRLPDYAQIRHWLVVAPFTVENGLWTGTGRPRRQQIWQHYKKQIASIYRENT